MPDRIYVTYSPTTAPESYHAAIHYERTDASGNVTQHLVIEAKPSRYDQLNAVDKALGVIEETFRQDNGASRFGNIDAKVRQPTPEDQTYPYEIIAEGPDLSSNLAKIQLYAAGVNSAGFAYRGDHQNSNTFTSGGLQAGDLPAATGVAHDPTLLNAAR
jgi:hypothetical protein